MIDNAADRDVSAAKVLMRRVFEVTVSMRITERPMLAERFHEVAPLHAMQQDVPAEIRAVEQPPQAIEIEPPRVAAPFAEEFELTGRRVIPPDSLLKLDAANAGRDRTSLAAVEPAVLRWSTDFSCRRPLAITHLQHGV